MENPKQQTADELTELTLCRNMWNKLRALSQGQRDFVLGFLTMKATEHRLAQNRIGTLKQQEDLANYMALHGAQPLERQMTQAETSSEPTESGPVMARQASWDYPEPEAKSEALPPTEDPTSTT